MFMYAVYPFLRIPDHMMIAREVTGDIIVTIINYVSS